MDTPRPKKKNLLYDFFFLFFVCILEMMLIDEHPCLKNLDLSLSTDVDSLTSNMTY